MADDYSGDSSTTGVVTLGIAQNGDIEAAADVDWFKVSLVAGTLYHFELRGWDSGMGTFGQGAAEAYLVLRAPDGSFVRDAKDGGVGGDPALSFTPTVSGAYFLVAEELYNLGIGSYVLQATAMPAGSDDFRGDNSTTAVVAVGGSLNGNLELPYDTDWFRVNLQAGTTYALELRAAASGAGTLGSGLSVPALTLLDNSGLQLKTDSTGGPGDDPQIVFTPSSTGNHFLKVQELYDSGTGSYTVSLREAASLLLVNLPAASEADGFLTFTLSLSKPLATAASVTVSTRGESWAGERLDYLPKSETVNFAPGQTTATFGVPLINDIRFEPTETLSIELSAAVGLVFEANSAFGLVLDNDTPASLRLPSDPLLPLQWALYPGPGANVLSLWPEFDGRGVRIGLLDQGVDAAHTDLDGPLQTALGRNTVLRQPGGQPVLTSDVHGTAAAGVIAAENNGSLGVGVAYGAQLVSLYTPLSGSATEQSAQVLDGLRSAGDLHVLNTQWGQGVQAPTGTPWAYLDNFLEPPFAAVGSALQSLADSGRAGLGTVVVQEAGNAFGAADNTNLHNLQNSRYVVTVASTAFDGRVTSVPGASILVAAPGGGGGTMASHIVTTDRSGAAGYSSEDWAPPAGVALASPVVTGVVALMLQANPNLGWRDVQKILAYSARQAAADQTPDPFGWQFNRAGDWNGGGLHYDGVSQQLGFGVVDAVAAVRLAESWRSPAQTSANMVELRSTLAQTAPIPDGDGLLVQTQNVTRSIELERAEVTVQISHPQRGDLSLLLTGPGGTSSWLISRTGDNSSFGNAATLNFTFSTVAHWGESSVGEWQLAVFDLVAGGGGQLLSWTLNLVGKADSADNVYVYTNEFAASVGNARERAQLSDSGGLDTINAAAVSSASLIDLSPGATSRINGQALNLDASTTIESAHGGDGNDTLLGNNAINNLYGMRGNDRLRGGAGDDVLDGGAGIDSALFAATRTQSNFSALPIASSNPTVRYSVSSTVDGTDTLQGVERLLFADVALALDINSGRNLGAGNAGIAAKAVNALLGKTYVRDKAVVGAVLDLLDQGMSYEQLITLGVSHPLFAQLAGAASGTVSATQFVRQVYFNVVGVQPDAQALALFSDILTRGEMTQSQLAMLASETDLNAVAVDLVGLATTGLEFMPVGG